MNPLVRAETRRLLRHPLALTLAVLFVFGSLYCAWVSQNMASHNITQVQANLDFLPRSCDSPRNTPQQKAGCLAEVPCRLPGWSGSRTGSPPKESVPRKPSTRWARCCGPYGC